MQNHIHEYNLEILRLVLEMTFHTVCQAAKHISKFLILMKKIAVLFTIPFLALPFFFPYFIAKPTYDNGQFKKEIAALNIKQQDSSRQPYFIPFANRQS